MTRDDIWDDPPLTSEFVRSMALDAALILLAAVASRVIALNQAGFYDEYYHILAARQWLADGTLGSELNGTYGRAIGFTFLVRESIRAFGDSLVAARLPALLAGVLWPAVVYIGIRNIDVRRSGALIAAALMIFDPMLLGLSQVARFYTLHGLLYWIGVFGAYSATRRTGSPRWRTLSGLLAVAGFAGAFHLQLITLIGFGAVATGLVAANFSRILERIGSSRHDYRAWLGGGLIAVVGVVAVWLGHGTLVSWWHRFNSAPLWLVESGSSFRFYHWQLQANYPLFWGLFPLACVIAGIRHFRLAIMCAVALGVIIVTSSAAASQHFRYIAYALPFLFIIWGQALSEIVPWLLSLSRRAAKQFWGRPWATVPFTIVIISFAALNTPAWIKTVRAIRPWNPTAPYSTWTWPAAGKELESQIGPETIIVSSAGPQVLYHIGRLDFNVGQTEFAAGEQDIEFSRDRRIGRRVISTVESFERIVDCFADGVFITRNVHWRQSWAVNEDLADWIVANLDKVTSTEDSSLRVYRWTTHGMTVGAPDCPTAHSSD